MRLRRLVGLSGGGPDTEADGIAIATVAARLEAGARGLPATTRGAAILTVASRGCGDSPAKAAVRASTNAVAVSHLASGALARPRRITASTAGVSAALRVLGAGGSRWT